MGTLPHQKDKRTENESPNSATRPQTNPFAKQQIASPAKQNPFAKQPQGFPKPQTSPFAKEPQGFPKPQTNPFAKEPQAFPKPQTNPFAQQQGFTKPQTNPFAQQQGFTKPQTNPFAQQQVFTKPQTDPFAQQQGFTKPQTNPFAQQQGFTEPQTNPFAQLASQAQQTSRFASQQRSAKDNAQSPFGKKQESFTRPFFRQTTPPSDQARSTFGQERGFTATPSFTKDLAITNEEFILLRDFIYKKCGIFIADARKYLVENRLSNRIKSLNLKNYTEYYKYLKFDDHKEAELNELFVLMTTNETSFYRNPPQLKVFQETILPNILNQVRKTGQKRLRIWSAGCSTGEEPYTLAIIIAEVLRTELPMWDVRITANDLSTQVLAAARQGLYSEYALRTTPKDIIQRYFTKDGQVYKINTDMKRLISFSQINLNEREQLRRVENSHIVFCRNVIIYFDDDMKRRVINAFYDNLLPGGALLIGHSESLHNICRSFQLEHYAGTIVYRKLG